jgi:hypothetical protein
VQCPRPPRRGSRSARRSSNSQSGTAARMTAHVTSHHHLHHRRRHHQPQLSRAARRVRRQACQSRVSFIRKIRSATTTTHSVSAHAMARCHPLHRQPYCQCSHHGKSETCQNDALENGTCETQLSSPKWPATSASSAAHGHYPDC